MSNQEPPKHEPAKRAPQVTPKVTKQATSEPKPRKRRGFFSQLFSHLMVATIAVIAVAAYMHWRDVLQYTGARVCSYNVLGKYASQPPKVPPIDLTKPAKEKPKQSTQSPVEKAPAKDKPQDKSQDKPATTPVKAPVKAQNFDDALEAARKLFWTKDPATAPAYEKLITKNPDNADLQAELGNVYFKLEKKDQATSQFFKAGKLYAKQKNPAKVAEMVKILEKLAPEKAKELSAINVKDNQ